MRKKLLFLPRGYFFRDRFLFEVESKNSQVFLFTINVGKSNAISFPSIFFIFSLFLMFQLNSHDSATEQLFPKNKIKMA